jgi:hypothetical protein
MQMLTTIIDRRLGESMLVALRVFLAFVAGSYNPVLVQLSSCIIFPGSRSFFGVSRFKQDFRSLGRFIDG